MKSAGVATKCDDGCEDLLCLVQEKLEVDTTQTICQQQFEIQQRGVVMGRVAEPHRLKSPVLGGDGTEVG